MTKLVALQETRVNKKSDCRLGQGDEVEDIKVGSLRRMTSWKILQW